MQIQIRPDEITSILRSRIEGLEGSAAELAEVGTVISVADGICRIHGLDDCMSMELLELPHGVTGLALNLESDNVGAVLFGPWDRIEEGDLHWRQVLERFYGPFQRRLREGERQSRDVLREVAAPGAGPCPACGRPLQLRWSRHGRFLGCSGYPDCRYTRPVDEKPDARPRPIGEPCPECGGELVERHGRNGPFVACANYPRCTYTRARTVPGLKCPRCQTGDIAEKRTRRGKTFWSCTRYPECDWSSWDRPVPEPCPQCGAPFRFEKTTRRETALLCPNCGAREEAASEAPADDEIPGEPAAEPKGDAA